MHALQLTPWPEADMVIRLMIAAVAGAITGYERERAEKPAGLRTMALVCVGAALFTVCSIYGFLPGVDTSRVASSIVAGVGFLGAGSIIRGELGVQGLTTAATIWVVASVGLAIGAGLYLAGLVTLGLVLIILRLPH